MTGKKHKSQTQFWIRKASSKAERFIQIRGVLDAIATSGIWHLSKACSQILQHQASEGKYGK